MAYDGVIQCFQQKERWFTGVVVTNGSGSPRAGVYKKYSDAEMVLVRRKEQKKAAMVGDYAAQFLLDQPSAAIKDANNAAPVDDLEAILRVCRPEVVYTHNLADKHDTHVGVALKLIGGIRRLPADLRPKRLYGCEVWRDLDWLSDDVKQCLPASKYPNIAAALVGVFDSQVSGGKRYDLATAGRRLAHATYYASHATDTETAMNFAMDLTPLVANPGLAVAPFVTAFIDNFKADVEKKLAQLIG